MAPDTGLAAAPPGAPAPGPRQLCGLLGHELRNPLASAAAGLAVLAEMTDADDPRARFVERASQDLDRLGTLLRRYLAFGRGSRPRLQQSSGEALLAALRRRAPDAPRVDVGFATAAAATRPLHCDPELLGRALDNLIENAGAVGAQRVVVRLRELGDIARLELSDDGPGVPAALRDALFEPFVSGRGSSGLGLAIVRDIVTGHAGRVYVGGAEDVAAALGGACFVLEIPFTPAEAGA